MLQGFFIYKERSSAPNSGLNSGLGRRINLVQDLGLVQDGVIGMKFLLATSAIKSVTSESHTPQT